MATILANKTQENIDKRARAGMAVRQVELQEFILQKNPGKYVAYYDQMYSKGRKVLGIFKSLSAAVEAASGPNNKVIRINSYKTRGEL